MVDVYKVLHSVRVLDFDSFGFRIVLDVFKFFTKILIH